MEGLTLQNYGDHCKMNESVIEDMLQLAKSYHKVGLSNSLTSEHQSQLATWVTMWPITNINIFFQAVLCYKIF